MKGFMDTYLKQNFSVLTICEKCFFRRTDILWIFCKKPSYLSSLQTFKLYTKLFMQERYTGNCILNTVSCAAHVQFSLQCSV